MKRILLSLFVGWCFGANAQPQSAPYPIDTCAAQIPYGKPLINRSNSTLICRKAYLLQYDNEAKIPVWVSYVLTSDHAVGCAKRSNSFSPDYSLPHDRRSLVKDYARSGYDIGHQASNGDMSWDEVVEQESFIMSNMAPQLPGFNRGVWRRLEDQVRAWSVNSNSNLLVYVGPVYTEKDKKIGANRVTVPSGFYKIVINIKTNQILVFEFDHKATTLGLNSFVTTLEKVETDAGIKFSVPANGEVSSKVWPSPTKTARVAKRNNCVVK